MKLLLLLIICLIPNTGQSQEATNLILRALSTPNHEEVVRLGETVRMLCESNEIIYLGIIENYERKAEICVFPGLVEEYDNILQSISFDSTRFANIRESLSLLSAQSGGWVEGLPWDVIESADSFVESLARLMIVQSQMEKSFSAIREYLSKTTYRFSPLQMYVLPKVRAHLLGLDPIAKVTNYYRQLECESYQSGLDEFYNRCELYRRSVSGPLHNTYLPTIELELINVISENSVEYVPSIFAINEIINQKILIRNGGNLQSAYESIREQFTSLSNLNDLSPIDRESVAQFILLAHSSDELKEISSPEQGINKRELFKDEIEEITMRWADVIEAYAERGEQ